MVLPGQRLGCHDYKCKIEYTTIFIKIFLAYTVKTGSSAFIILTLKIITANKNATSMAALTMSCLTQSGTRLLSRDSSLTPDARFSCGGRHAIRMWHHSNVMEFIASLQGNWTLESALHKCHTCGWVQWGVAQIYLCICAC